MRILSISILFLFICISFVQGQTYVSNRHGTISKPDYNTKETKSIRTVSISGDRYKVQLPDKSYLTGSLTFDRTFKRDGNTFKSFKMDNGGTLIISEEHINVSLFDTHKFAITYYLMEKADLSSEEITDKNGNCTFISNKVDDFTGVRELKSESMTMSIYEGEYESGSIEFTLTNDDDGYYLLVSNTYSSKAGVATRSKCLDGTSKVLIKKEDNSIIELPAIDHTTCSEYIKGNIKAIVGAFKISEENAQKLKSGISRFRIQFTESQLDGDFGGMATILNLKTKEMEEADKVESLNSKFFFSRWISCMENAMSK